MNKRALLLTSLVFIILGIVMLSFSMPISAAESGQPASMSNEMWEWHKNAPTFFFEQSSSWGYLEYMWDGRFYRTFVSMPTAGNNIITYNAVINDTSVAEYKITITVDTSDNSSFLYTAYTTTNLYPDNVDTSYLNDGYTILFPSDTQVYFYWNNSSDSIVIIDGSVPWISLTKDNFYYNYPAQSYGKAGTPFFWNCYKYHTVLQASDGSFSTGGANNGNPMLFLSYNQTGDYIGLKEGPQYSFLNYGVFSAGADLTNGKDTVAYTYSASGNLSTSQLKINNWESTTYIYYSPTPPKVIWSNLPVHYANGTIVEANHSPSQIELEDSTDELDNKNHQFITDLGQLEENENALKPDVNDIDNSLNWEQFANAGEVECYQNYWRNLIEYSPLISIMGICVTFFVVRFCLFGGS